MYFRKYILYLPLFHISRRRYMTKHRLPLLTNETLLTFEAMILTCVRQLGTNSDLSNQYFFNNLHKSIVQKQYKFSMSMPFFINYKYKFIISLYVFYIHFKIKKVFFFFFILISFYLSSKFYKTL